MTAGATWMIAHQGGWDEILLFVAPVLIAVGAVRWAERRSRRRREADVDPASGDGGATTVTVPEREDEA